MAKIKINELSQEMQISKEEMKKVFGGFTASAPRATSQLLQRQQFINPGSLVATWSCGDCGCDCACDKVANLGNMTKTMR